MNREEWSGVSWNFHERPSAMVTPSATEGKENILIGTAGNPFG
ncbi:hypothetical protein [Micromonospora zhanjiangensis]|uniref:Uncharacterized protein n=1 Tax=Micromonospora zhanjiangensis TaxID=1522057 RepID=A0ABV8KLC4_9ACTN